MKKIKAMRVSHKIAAVLVVFTLALAGPVPFIALSQGSLEVCYITETVTIADSGDSGGLALMIEVERRRDVWSVQRFVPILGGAIDISRLIPRANAAATRLAVVDTSDVRVTQRGDVFNSAWWRGTGGTDDAGTSRVSAEVELLPRGERIVAGGERREIWIDYANERIVRRAGTPGAVYYVRKSQWGNEWQQVDLTGDGYLCIANFMMTTQLQIRRAPTETTAAGMIMRISVRGRPLPPIVRVHTNQHTGHRSFHGANRNMQYSTDNGSTWRNVTENRMSVEGHGGEILFRRSERRGDEIHSLFSFPLRVVIPPPSDTTTP